MNSKYKLIILLALVFSALIAIGQQSGLINRANQEASGKPIPPVFIFNPISAWQTLIDGRGDKALAERFVNAISPTGSVIPAHIGSFAAVDLSQTGSKQLVVSVDYSDRGFYNTLLIVSRQGNTFVPNTLTGWGLSDVSTVIKDVAQDGRLELVVPQSVSDYEGASCVAATPLIYRWNNQAFSDVSKSFPNFYRDLQYQITLAEREVSSEPSTAEDTRKDLVACKVMEQTKIARILGTDPHAGFDNAKAWMNDSDPKLRRKAARVFQDIGDSESIRMLHSLATDPDPSVREMAIPR